jgi:hypothetical protein
VAYRYKTIKRGGKTKLLHRHIAEQKLGRPLGPDEHVHHDNEQRWDNRPDNLEVLPAVEHQRLHADQRLVYPREKACAVCGAAFTPAATKRKRKLTCSKPCADRLRSITTTTTKARAIVEANYAQADLRRAA